MKPAEFWSAAMSDVAVFVDESNKRDVTAAWRIALLGNMDPKKFPKTPSALWKKKRKKTPDEMFATLQRFAERHNSILEKKP